MKILIVVDMQNDFIDGALGTKEAQLIVPAVRAKVKQYEQDADSAIIYTRDTHFADYLYSQEGKNLPVEHCIQYTHGWQINPDVYIFGSPIIDKKSFGYVDWSEALINKLVVGNLADIESIELVGLCTDICVISNAMILKAIFPEVPITVDSTCCAGVTPESHTNALNAMKMCQINIK